MFRWSLNEQSTKRHVVPSELSGWPVWNCHQSTQAEDFCTCSNLSPLQLNTDHNLFSLYNIITCLNMWVMRINGMITKGRSWCIDIQTDSPNYHHKKGIEGTERRIYMLKLGAFKKGKLYWKFIRRPWFAFLFVHTKRGSFQKCVCKLYFTSWPSYGPS